MEAAKKITLEDAWEIITALAKAQKETSRQLKVLGELQGQEAVDDSFDTPWSRLVENVTGFGGGSIAQGFSRWGIKIQRTQQRTSTKINGKWDKFDAALFGDDEIIAVDARTTLDVDDVESFIEKLKRFKQFLPAVYADKKVYGAVAYIVASSDSDKYSEKQKLFVIKATGNNVSIINARDFTPRSF